MQIKQHKLEGDADIKVEWEPTPNKGGKLENSRPDTIVIHYTAGASAQSSVKTLCSRGTRASAHLVIGREGDIYQLVPFDTVAWHAGRSSYKGRSGFNRYSVGIELDNPGQLTPNGTGEFLTWYNKRIAPENAVQAIHRNQREPTWWHRFKDTQIELTEMICRLLIEKYDIQMIVGHEEIAPQRKVDPGPAFPLDKIRTRLLLEDRSEEKPEKTDRRLPSDAGIVAAGKLNIRSGPGISHQTVADPLQGGELVHIVGEQSGWLEVAHTTRGWVKAEFIDRAGKS